MVCETDFLQNENKTPTVYFWYELWFLVKKLGPLGEKSTKNDK